ncbi:MAG: Hsp20/alpha crystallin family protein [Lentisphaeria bacterium]|nr:Hsp20/alpha crystallin family protein [Lentisphaeria bacterium]
MNLLAKREHEVPAELEKVFPGVDELMRSFFGRFIEPGSGLLRSSVFDSRWETEVKDKEVIVKISCPGCKQCDFELEIVGDILNFKMHRKEECNKENNKENCGRRYIFRERSLAEYSESIKLTVPVKGAEAKAHYKHGVIEVVIPRNLESHPAGRTIKIDCCK